MEFLERARSLLETLRKRARELDEIKEEMRVASFENLEVLYAEEFDVAIEMSDIFETLNLMLDKMEESEDSAFIASRLRTQAEIIIGEHTEYDFQ